jgi:hypothetical protein
MLKFSIKLSLAIVLLGGTITGTAQYVRPEIWSPGPIRYSPCWRQPYYGYPYPCAQPPCPESPGVQAPGTAGPGQLTGPRKPAAQLRRQAPSATLPPRPPPSGPTALPPRPVPPRRAAPVAPAPSPRSSPGFAWQGGSGYRYQGSVIEGPEGPAYQTFGTRPPLGTPYQRYGNMLYGPGSRCQLFGNTAVCW